MEADLRAVLGLSTLKFKGCASGCIHEGKIYETENGPIFVKISKDANAKSLFKGEMEGLKAMQNTRTVRVPKPIEIISLKDKSTCLIMEYLDMKSLSKFAEELGDKLARMHLYNSSLEKTDSSIHKKLDEETQNQTYVNKFGFHVATCCGRIPQENTWKDDWVEFYSQQRLDSQLKLIETNYADKETRDLWSELSLKLPTLFKDIEIKPSLLHGDLWSGNAASTDEGPVIFDPAVFYGHDEYDLAIADMFGGFPKSFYNAYHQVIPKKPNFEKRLDLYKLFHCLNHWNHFGSGYRSSSISIMKRLLKDM